MNRLLFIGVTLVAFNITLKAQDVDITVFAGGSL
jgi:hypothetical protein